MLYVVLPVHNRISTTRKTIECLMNQSYLDFRIILVDDGSEDGTSKMVLYYFPNTIILRGDGSLWWGGSLQKAYDWLKINATDSDDCLILNDDTYFDEDFLLKGMELLEIRKKTLICAVCYSQQNGALLDKGIFFNNRKMLFEQAKVNNKINCLSTRGLFLKMIYWKEIGGFFPKILPHYLSDYEFTIRAHKKGFNLATTDDLKLFVDEETTGIHSHISKEDIKSYYKNYFGKRNTNNPIYLMNFTVLAVPFPYKFKYGFKYFTKTLFKLIEPILNSDR